jgi:hypothetical protein
MAAPARDWMRKHRRQMHAWGFRPLNRWVHDTADPHVRAEIKAEVATIRAHDRPEDTEAYVDAVLADIEGWTGARMPGPDLAFEHRLKPR